MTTLERDHLSDPLPSPAPVASHFPPRSAFRHVLLAALGGFVAIAAIALLASNFHAALMLGSFGASCVLVFGFPDAPFSQPRNVVIGHTLSSFVGLLCLTLFGPHWWAVALAVSLAIAAMMLTRTVHPPAGSNPVIIFLAMPQWDFLLFPTLSGALVLATIGLLYNRVLRGHAYPKYW
ncbi:HPP family protein [Oxalicibacterium solurbis]|uniref:HPP family protein n=1 Tax=Oxalicibacterium solurbis TaxID=69280 RepID=UPI00166CE019|nr:HPP family protein [Oxalicibacterium solurbis]